MDQCIHTSIVRNSVYSDSSLLWALVDRPGLFGYAASEVSFSDHDFYANQSDPREGEVADLSHGF